LLHLAGQLVDQTVGIGTSEPPKSDLRFRVTSTAKLLDGDAAVRDDARRSLTRNILAAASGLVSGVLKYPDTSRVDDDAHFLTAEAARRYYLIAPV